MELNELLEKEELGELSPEEEVLKEKLLAEKEEAERLEAEETEEEKAARLEAEEAERLEAEEAERLKAEGKEDYTQEELDQFIADGETEQLKEWGLPQFRSFEEMAKGVKKFFDEDKTVYPIVKKLAAGLKMTPQQFIQAVEKKIGSSAPAKAKGKEAGPDPYEDRFKALESDRGRVQLDLAFDRFQRRMEKQEVDVPDDLKSKLVDLLPAVLPREYDPQKTNWSKTFEDAYDLHLWRLTKEKSPQKLKDGLSALEARRLRKRLQLGIPSGKTKTKGVSKSDVEAYGAGITKL